MGWFKRTFGNDPIESYPIVEPASRGRARPAVAPGERRFSITCTLGSFPDVSLDWEDVSAQAARDSFMEWLSNDPEFDAFADRPGWRTVNANFNGQWVSVTFRTEWVAGFAVAPPR